MSDPIDPTHCPTNGDPSAVSELDALAELLRSSREERPAASSETHLDLDASRLARVAAELETERRTRARLQEELEALEDRHEAFVRERVAQDESARTLHDRFRARTERLYRALVNHEGGIGAQVADATKELMEASETLIRLQNDRDSLVRQVERLRVALRRATGSSGEAPVPATAPGERGGADAERVTLALREVREHVARSLARAVQDLEERIDRLDRKLGAGEPASSSPAIDRIAQLARFYGEGSGRAPAAATFFEPAPLEASPARPAPPTSSSAFSPAGEPLPPRNGEAHETRATLSGEGHETRAAFSSATSGTLSNEAPTPSAPRKRDTTRTSRIAPAAEDMKSLLERSPQTSRRPRSSPRVVAADPSKSGSLATPSSGEVAASPRLTKLAAQASEEGRAFRSIARALARMTGVHAKAACVLVPLALAGLGAAWTVEKRRAPPAPPSSTVASPRRSSRVETAAVPSPVTAPSLAPVITASVSASSAFAGHATAPIASSSARFLDIPGLETKGE